MPAPRKITLGPEFCPYPYERGGKADCDHDYPPESKHESDDGADWTCSKCGMNVAFDFYE